MTELRVKKGEIYIKDIFDFIESNPITNLYEIYCRIMTEDENKIKVSFPKDVRFCNVKSVAKWMREIDNYSSFYLNVIDEGIVIEQYKINPNE